MPPLVSLSVNLFIINFVWVSLGIFLNNVLMVQACLRAVKGKKQIKY